jgi:hypothetical protein
VTLRAHGAGSILAGTGHSLTTRSSGRGTQVEGDFVLEISGTGSAISLEPVGMIDAEGARTLLDALGTLRSDHAALVEIRLDRVTGLTDGAWRLLASSELPVEALAASAH